jgi:hypothetical protein
MQGMVKNHVFEEDAVLQILFAMASRLKAAFVTDDRMGLTGLFPGDKIGQ